jgi:hypothetical protein
MTTQQLTTTTTAPTTNGHHSTNRPRTQARRREPLDDARYWVGTALTAGVTALVAALGLVLASGVLGLPVVLDEAGRLVPVRLGALTLIAAALAVGAGALYHLMLALAPRPNLYYAWLTGLGTTLAVLWPFAGHAPLLGQIAVAVISLTVGLVITLLVPLAAVRTRA